MLTLSVRELQDITGGKAPPSKSKLSFQGVEFDSREIKGGELFIALKGGVKHGHDFLSVAYERGASLFLVEDEAKRSLIPEPERVIVVEDTLKAFWKLASWWRRELKIPILAITGSVGKTTTKEIAASILLRHAKGGYSLKSHNNHTGVPYTLCRISRDDSWGVLEMGMNHAGELRELSKLAEPDVVAVTCIAPAHIQAFSSLDEIADAKLEIIDGLSDKGTIILNGEDTTLLDAFSRYAAKGSRKVLYFGNVKESRTKVKNVKSEGVDGISFHLDCENLAVDAKMSIIGTHNALNAACAALASKILIPTLSSEELTKGLGDFRAPLMRLNMKYLTGERKIIDDSYNANPASMSASLKLLGDFMSQGLRGAAILGDMLELGAFSEEYHKKLATEAAALKLEFLIAVGEHANIWVEAAKAAGIKAFVANTPEAAGHLAGKLPFGILLTKGSRGVGLERSVQVLMRASSAEGAG